MPTSEKLSLARSLDREAYLYVSAPGDPHNPTPWTDGQVLAMYDKLSAWAYVSGPDGVYHVVGLSRRGRLVFFNHTVKQLRRELAFRELGGRCCCCARYLDVFGGWFNIGLPAAFRRQINKAMAVRNYRTTTPLKTAGWSGVRHAASVAYKRVKRR